MKGIWLCINDLPYDAVVEDLVSECFTDAFIFASGYDELLPVLTSLLHEVGIKVHLCVDCFSGGGQGDLNRWESIVNEIKMAESVAGIDGYNLDFVRFHSWGFNKVRELLSGIDYITRSLRDFPNTSGLVSSASTKLEIYWSYWLNKLWVKGWYGQDFEAIAGLVDFLMPMAYSRLYSGIPILNPRGVKPSNIKSMCDKLQERTGKCVFPSLQAYYSVNEPNSIGRLPTWEEINSEINEFPEGYALFLYRDMKAGGLL